MQAEERIRVQPLPAAMPEEQTRRQGAETWQTQALVVAAAGAVLAAAGWTWIRLSRRVG